MEEVALWAIGGLVVTLGGAAIYNRSVGMPPLGTNAKRVAVVQAAKGLLGTLYQWGGGRNPATDQGVDCSGLIIRAHRIAGLPLPPCGGATSDAWWQCLERIAPAETKPADLALFGRPDRAVHVELVTRIDGDKVTMLGANGGDRDVTSPAIAASRNAMVKWDSMSISQPRGNFIGFCRNPIETNQGTAIDKMLKGLGFVPGPGDPNFVWFQEDEA